MISFLEKYVLFEKLGYKKFFGPPLAKCLDGEAECPKCLLFVVDERRMSNAPFDFALLYEIEHIRHLDLGLCEVRAKAKLFSLIKEDNNYTAQLKRESMTSIDYQIFIVKECFLCPEELLNMRRIEFM